MTRKPHLDASGVLILIIFAFLLGLNQVVIKVTHGGLQPVFAAGLRSLGALLVLILWLWVRGKRFRFHREVLWSGLACGTAFGVEFIFLFLALDLTDVARSSVLFYTMPVWATIAAHFLLPGERMRPVQAVGLLLAVAGVAWALLNRSGTEAPLLGDILALGAAFMWAAIALIARAGAFGQEPAETQLLWQLAVSTPILLVAALFFGPFLRETEVIHIAGLLFQILAIAFGAFLLWFWLLKIYPAASVVSFSFLTPILSVLLGWMLLGETLGVAVIGGLVLVVAGLFLINRPPPAA